MAQALTRDPVTGALINTGQSTDYTMMLYYRRMSAELERLSAEIHKVHDTTHEIKSMIETLLINRSI